VAATERVEEAGSEQYHENHMGAIFKAGFSFSGYERDLLVLNREGGNFLDISGVSGVDSISDGRGSSFADLDNDGDLDIFLTTAQGEAHYLFRNNIGNGNAWLRVELEGAGAGRDAYGAIARVKTADGVQAKLKAGGSGFLSQHDGRLLFGLGSADEAEWIEVVWPGGETQRVGRVAARSAIRIVQGVEGYTTVAEQRFSLVDPLDPREAFLAGLGLRKGEPFPDIDLRSVEGLQRKLQQLVSPGRKLLINLWATWCVPCAEEIPQLQRLHPALRDAGVDLVGVSVDLETVDNVPSYLASRQVSYPVYTTNESAMELLYPRGEATVPLTVLLDADGRILDIYSGWSEESETAVLRLAGKTLD